MCIVLFGNCPVLERWLDLVKLNVDGELASTRLKMIDSDEWLNPAVDCLHDVSVSASVRKHIRHQH